MCSTTDASTNFAQCSLIRRAVIVLNGPKQNKMCFFSMLCLPLHRNGFCYIHLTFQIKFEFIT